jgi:hypothetical protein
MNEKKIAVVTSRVADFIVALRGLRVRQKDKDMMADTGGVSKNLGSKPKSKPPRDDVRKPFRKKNKPAEQYDLDTDRDQDRRGD